MTYRQKSALVVGTGVVGLLSAYELIKRGYRVSTIDAGPDPRGSTTNSHNFGATYSGLDARHISVTETGPWTSPKRADLIHIPASERGWLAIPQAELTAHESDWLDEFVELTTDADIHLRNSSVIFERNLQSMKVWAQLCAELPAVFSPTTTTGRMGIVCASSEELFGEHDAESALDPENVNPPSSRLPDVLAPLQPEVDRRKHVGSGAFELAGSAFLVKTLCVSLLDWLDSEGVRMEFNRKFDSTESDWAVAGIDAIVYCGGVSVGSSDLVRSFKHRLQGVLGCWADLENPGIAQPFKILAPEPTNFMNLSPKGDRLLVSGGYGFVGERSLAEARYFAGPTMKWFVKDLMEWFPAQKRLLESNVCAICIRPSLPAGVSMVDRIEYRGIPVIFNIGHAAGGFTQAPLMAQKVCDSLADL